MNQTKKCPDCSTELNSGDNFCIKCGFNFAKYEETKKEKLKENEKECPECKQILNKEITNCTNCGFPFPIKKIVPPSIQNIPVPPKQIQDKPKEVEQSKPEETIKSNRTIYFIVGGTLFLIVCCAIWYWLASPSKEELAIRNKTIQDSIAIFEMKIQEKNAEIAQKKLNEESTINLSNSCSNNQQTVQSNDFTKSFSGTIDNKYSIVMDLSKRSHSLSGSYKYLSQSIPLKITGEINDNGVLTINEFNDKGNMTGIFKGQLINESISGQWSTPDGSKQMVFALTEK